MEAYSQHFVRILKAHVGQSNVERALRIIVSLWNNHETGDETKQILLSARKQIDRGNRDVVRRVIQIGDELGRRRSQLIPASMDEIDALLRDSIGKLIKRVETQQGAPGIVLGIIK